MNGIRLEKVNDYLWEVPPRGRMRVPARIYATAGLLKRISADNAPEQAVNVACLPGIVKASLAMPDFHWGYGFPIGGVAAFDTDEGVVSPGGVGYDINCGVRLMAADMVRGDLRNHVRKLMEELFATIPSGVGAAGALKVGQDDMNRVAVEGAEWAVGRGFGDGSDLERIEEGGRMAEACPADVSKRAVARGLPQLGTLGSGNHFIEVGYVDEIYDEPAAAAFGLFPEQVTLTVHCGSRGYGHQVCDDYLSVMDKAVRKYGIQLPDRQLACAPVTSDEGQAYLRAMRCAVNFAFANRQVIAHQARKAFTKVLHGGRGIELRTVYEVAHNIAKIETHNVEGRERELCVHRKGATRAFSPARSEVPAEYRDVGQPVLVPGDMGRCSYVLAGTEKAMRDTFGSTCHGAGRAMSRQKAKRAAQGRDIARELEKDGIVVIGQSRRTLLEEMPEAYKDVTEVVDACALAGISLRVARLRPLGCIKG
ncbi:RtcB family protein [Verrucomicrobiota bacterium]